MNLFLRFSTLLFLCCFIGGVECTHAQTTYSYTFAQDDLGTSDSPKKQATLNNVTWELSYTLKTSDAYLGWDNNSSKGLQLGSGGNAPKPFSEYSLSTSAFSGSITSVTVNASTANSGTASIEVSVGGTTYGSESLSTTAADYTFKGSASGELKISLKQSTSKALYIKSISVTYAGSSTPPHHGNY